MPLHEVHQGQLVAELLHQVDPKDLPDLQGFQAAVEDLPRHPSTHHFHPKLHLADLDHLDCGPPLRVNPSTAEVDQHQNCDLPLRVNPSTAEVGHLLLNQSLDHPLRVSPSPAEDDLDLWQEILEAQSEADHFDALEKCNTQQASTVLFDFLGQSQPSSCRTNPPTTCRPLDAEPFDEVSTELELEHNEHSHALLASDRSRNGSSRIPKQLVSEAGVLVIDVEKVHSPSSEHDD